MEEVRRLTIATIGRDPRSAGLLADAHALGLTSVTNIDVSDIVFISGGLDADQHLAIENLLVDPLLQTATWETPAGQVIETALHPGVTDAAGTALAHATHVVQVSVGGVATGRSYSIRGHLTDEGTQRLAASLLANQVVEQWSIGPIEPAFIDGGAAPGAKVCTVDIASLDDEGLLALNRDRGLALDLAELHAIVEHFAEAGRSPSDVELEMLAQTWSEHCSHKTFRAQITTDDATAITPLLRQLRDATDTIAAPFLRSAFVGNAGIVSFSPGTTLAVKAETHNHPSAIEPFGGSNTGVGGVIRDVMGAAHRPIAITDVLCFGPTDLDPAELPVGVLHPRLIKSGVIAGVADYGNKIGLPTVAGAVLYDPGYTANPLVYAGCIGVAAEGPALTGPHPGDLVVVLGGRTGRDGLRGATFSSATMDATTGDVAGASVQIGDPIVEKLLIDALEDLAGLFTAITDCGAGGLSSAIGEMAEGVGADVDVLLAPLKYPGLEPWEIWLSEAQERMVVAVDPASWADVLARCHRHGVEATALGSFTGDGQLIVRAGNLVVAQLDTSFLHDGRPQRSMAAEMPTPDRTNVAPPVVDDLLGALLALLAHPNLVSKEAIVRRYDHEILGSTVVRPIVGHGGHADGVVLARPADTHGIAIGIGVNPWFGEIDPERMAHAVVDEAIRNVVAVGADPDRVALLDNFSWGDPRRPSTLGGLVAAVQGCCDASLAHSAPFVSGKDSLNNEYLGSDGMRHAVPPTLVITAVAHVPDANQVVTPDLKAGGNVLVLVGETACEFGGSHLLKVLAAAAAAVNDKININININVNVNVNVDVAGAVPAPAADAPQRYRRMHQALRSGRIAACHDVAEGGVAVAMAEMAIGGDLGVALSALPGPDPVSALFAESNSRFICELAATDVPWLSDLLGEQVVVLGTITTERMFALPGGQSVSIDSLALAFGGDR